jgi:hypothetical protein
MIKETKAEKQARKILTGSVFIAACFFGLATISAYKQNNLQNKKNPTIIQTQQVTPKGMSLSRIIRENGGCMNLIGTDARELRRKDYDGDGIYDLKQICSNGNAFYLSSIALSNPTNSIESWYKLCEDDKRDNK